ncbi:MAG: hypothetical protein ACI8PZ_001206 [Myxococcota bacterium]|jgi:hypothetical protein
MSGRATWTWMLGLGMLAACGADDKNGDSSGAVDDNTVIISMTNLTAAGELVTSDGDALDQTLAPGLVIVHSAAWTLFTEGSPLPWPEMEPLVEDGDNAPLYAVLGADPAVKLVESFAALDEDYAAVPMHPGDSAELEVTAEPGDRITVVAMLGQSNDVFVALSGIELADAPGEPVVSSGSLWDAGTEVNEEPGAGDNQAPRQAAPGSGEAEGGVVTAVDPTDPGGFTWPSRIVEIRID